MKSVSHLLALVTLVGLSFLPQGAWADWQAKVNTEVTGKDIAPIDGVMFSSQAGIRIDVSTPTSLSMIVQIKKKKAFTLLHLAKIVMESDLNQYQSHIPVCSTPQPKTCYEKLGLKKVGSETIQGKKCDVLEGKVGDSRTKVWHPENQVEGPPLKSVVTLENGNKVISQFSDVQVKVLPASLFVVPKGYRAGGQIEDLMKTFKGLSH